MSCLYISHIKCSHPQCNTLKTIQQISPNNKNAQTNLPFQYSQESNNVAQDTYLQNIYLNLFKNTNKYNNKVQEKKIITLDQLKQMYNKDIENTNPKFIKIKKQYSQTITKWFEVHNLSINQVKKLKKINHSNQQKYNNQFQLIQKLSFPFILLKAHIFILIAAQNNQNIKLQQIKIIQKSYSNFMQQIKRKIQNLQKIKQIQTEIEITQNSNFNFNKQKSTIQTQKSIIQNHRQFNNNQFNKGFNNIRQNGEADKIKIMNASTLQSHNQQHYPYQYGFPPQIYENYMPQYYANPNYYQNIPNHYPPSYGLLPPPGPYQHSIPLQNYYGAPNMNFMDPRYQYFNPNSQMNGFNYMNPNFYTPTPNNCCKHQCNQCNHEKKDTSIQNLVVKQSEKDKKQQNIQTKTRRQKIKAKRYYQQSQQQWNMNEKAKKKIKKNH